MSSTPYGRLVTTVMEKAKFTPLLGYIWLYHVVTPGIRVNSPYSIVLKISWVDYNEFRSFKVPCDVLIALGPCIYSNSLTYTCAFGEDFHLQREPINNLCAKLLIGNWITFI